VIVFLLALAACGGATPTAAPEATDAPAATDAPSGGGSDGSGIEGADEFGERYDADPAVLTKAVGTTEGVPDIAKAAFYRAGLPVDQAKMDLAVKCWQDKVCETGTGGSVTVALSDGFGEN